MITYPCWEWSIFRLSMFFSPLIPAIVVMKMFIIFYTKEVIIWSLDMWCVELKFLPQFEKRELSCYMKFRYVACWINKFTTGWKTKREWVCHAKFIYVACRIEKITTGWKNENYYAIFTWRRHQMATFSALLALCAGNSPISGEFPAQRPVELWCFLWSALKQTVE